MQCQTSKLKQRTQYLQSQIYTVIIPPKPKQEKPQPLSKKVESTVDKENISVNSNKQSYDVAIAELNKAWNKLSPEVLEDLRIEQNENNKSREKKCSEFAVTLDGNKQQQESVHLACEIPLIEERTKYLLQKVAPLKLTTKIAG